MILLSILALLISADAFADPILPYPRRTRSYSGFSTTVRGDNDVIGMSGANVAIPNSISSLELNPAGLTMTMPNVSAQILSNEMRDEAVTGADQNTIRSSQFGIAVIPNLWGYSFAYYSPSSEEGSFENPNTLSANHYQVSLRQMHFSISRSLLKRRLSVGASLIHNHLVRSIGEADYNANRLSYRLGAIYHLGNHFLVGASYSPSFGIGDPVPGSGAPEMPDFAQSVQVPSLLAFGGGWVPNRFFRAGISLLVIGRTPGAALLRDERMPVGESRSLQPRLGVNYILAQYANLKISTAAGMYYENLRVGGETNRLHGTLTLSVNPWFVNTGIGFDRASHYKNLILSLGIDVVRLARTLDLIPRDPVPPHNGFWPKPTEFSSDGLPAGLTAGEKKKYAAPTVGDVAEIIEDIPKNVVNKIEGLPPEHEKKKAPKRNGKKKAPN